MSIVPAEIKKTPEMIRGDAYEEALDTLENLSHNPALDLLMQGNLLESTTRFEQSSDHPITLDAQDLPVLLQEGLQFFHGITTIRGLRASSTSWPKEKDWSFEAFFTANHTPFHDS